MEKPQKEISHWADTAASQVIEIFGNKKSYVVATGISPSGVIHFGNFRETITSELVARALKEKGKKVSLIFSWDDFDRLRKVPPSVDKSFEEHIGKPICNVPDPFGCHSSYALHFETLYEEILPDAGIEPVFRHQHKKYGRCEYADEIKHCLLKRKEIKNILDQFRKEPLPHDYYPLHVYCGECGKDSTKVKSYDGAYTIEYICECGNVAMVDFRKKGIVKLPWRIDWPMRWHYEKVDFEPAGKEHSTPGGSRSTADMLSREVWQREPPVHLMYDFIILKAVGGKMSSSRGNVITLKEVLDIYQPEIVRYMFAGTRPNTEFFVSFDLDVLKVYEDFDKCERIYFNKDEAKDEKEYLKQKRIYELSSIKLPKKQPTQFVFRHLCNLLQMYEYDFKAARDYYKIKEKSDIQRLAIRLKCVKNWLEQYAPDDFKFTVQKELHAKLNEKEKEALLLLKDRLEKKDYDEKTLHQEFYTISQEVGMDFQELFKAAYKVLINKEKGPKLAHFILALGKERVVGLLGKL